MIKRSYYLVFLPILIAQIPFGGVEQPSVEEKIAVYSKPSVVRIESGCAGTYQTPNNRTYSYATGQNGTGFFINSNGYILTTAQTIEPSQGGEEGCKEQLRKNLETTLKEEYSASEAETIASRSVITAFQYSQDVLLPNYSQQSNSEKLRFSIKEAGPFKEGTSQNVAIIKVQLTDTPVLKIGDSDTVEILTKAMIIGYPISGNPQFSISDFDANSSVEASVFSGEVSNVNMRLNDNSLVLQLDVSVGYGSSGSPVLNNKGEVIGMIVFDEYQSIERMVTGANPIAIRTDRLLEYVSQASVRNEGGKADNFYRQGLDFFWRGDYEGAISNFERVQRLFPQHSEIDRLLEKATNADDNYDNPTPTNYTPWLIAAIAVVGSLLAVAYWFFRQQSSKLATANASFNPSSDLLLSPEPQAHKLPAAPPVAQTPKRNTVVGTEPYVELRNQQGQKYYLYLQKDVHRIGRELGWSDIENIPDDGWDVLSRRHVTLYKEGQSYRVYDGDKENGTPSRNGIFINNDKISETEGYVLRNGDCLQTGGNPKNRVFLTYYDFSSD
jgi:Trypsin-like peptidase domain/FHA domain